jgi:glucose/arabinose dehydrogenase
MPHLHALEPRALLAAVPAGFAESTVAANLAGPTAMAFAPDGRLFVAEQSGALRVVKNGQLLARPFATFKTDPTGERGLLGIAFHPNFAANRFVYVYYTVPAASAQPAYNHVTRVRADPANPDRVVKGSQREILRLNNLSNRTNHNGGAIHFGPDGKLYVATGENANGANAQSKANLLGKILRVNDNGTLPADNPFFNSLAGQNRAIWALGLRNPFSFAFQRGSSRMFINDVGQSTFEEINDGVAGSNYGWPTTEGPTTNPNFRPPIFSYGHGDGPTTGDSIVGAAFYTPTTRTFPKAYANDYFFADLTSGWIRRMDVATGQVVGFATGTSLPVALATANDGSLYYLERGFGSTTGAVKRIQYTANGANAVPAPRPRQFSTTLIA